jgi:hypothetical protein
MISNHSRPTCLLCQVAIQKRHFWPPILHMGRRHDFFYCEGCGSISLFPLPDPEQLAVMYSSPEPPFEEGSALPLHRLLQVEFLRDSAARATGPRLLDYACCGGFYLSAARQLGLSPTGVEFSADYAERISSNLGLEVLTPATLDCQNRVFDIVHLGHVLEHVPEPASLLSRLSLVSHPRTLWLIDGPLENNACLSRFVIDLGSRLRRRPHQEIEPQHLSSATARGQRAFFERLGFEVLRFEIREQPWPLPDRIQTGSPGEIAKWALAKVSGVVSGFLPGAGNLFHFAGHRTSHDRGGDSRERLGTIPVPGDGPLKASLEIEKR